MARYLNDLNDAGTLQNADLTIVQQSTIDKKTTLENIKNYVLEAVFPIGSIYTQLPNKSTPSELGYPGTWTNISSQYAGDFFRAEGGDASAFESGEQLDQMQRITGRFDGSSLYKTGYGSGALSAGGGTQQSRAQYDTGDQYGMAFDSADSPDARTSSTTDGETRPVNQTVRIWERTA